MGLRGKFNSILEECICDGRTDAHYIMSINVRAQEYHHSGDLTSIGREEFWKEVNRAMQKFDNDEISLRPRKQMVAVKSSTGARKLPTPLTMKHHHKEHTKRQHKHS